MSKIKVDGEFLDHGMLKSKSESAYDNHMVNAHGRPSTEHTSQRRKAALRFNATNVFGRMGQNPSINALTNANALAQQQMAQQNIQPLGNNTMYRPDMSQQVMTGSFDPMTQQVSMGIFGDQNARNMAVRGSGIMMHDDVQAKIQAKKAEIEKAKSEGGDPDIVYELKSDLMDLQKELAQAKKAHNSPAQTRGETYEEFKKRTGETSMKAYMRDNPTGSK